ncbi:uncharacterized protein LOC115390847 [Salarias fasciatus]|uniref:uncharacterized protein LOC115390847 n=1 Tax=Salarias fasciatus TaxID=181472 RepID=UPI001177046C|nr:uncharacterized protein LOC115390847 [Salarias fasciatus]
MSVQISSVRDSGRRLGQGEAATVGGLKPLHRFLKGQPKITGIVVLIIGSSLLCVNFAALALNETEDKWFPVLPSLTHSGLLMACGILYIVTEKNPTKRTVTISLALSVISVPSMIWVILMSVPNFHSYHYLNDYEYFDNYTNPSLNYHMVGAVLGTVETFNHIVGGITCLVMSVLAGAALRSTKSLAIVLMTATAPEAPID